MNRYRAREIADLWARNIGLTLSLLALFLLMLVYYQTAFQSRDRVAEIRCLALNMWHEARFEPDEGKEAVGLVTILRRASGLYPRTLCGVVYQSKQFSWTLIPNVLESEPKGAEWVPIQELATALYLDSFSRSKIDARLKRIGITRDTHFYKRADNIRVSKRAAWWFEHCTLPIIDPKDPKGERQLQIGAHAFHRAKMQKCIPPKMPDPKSKAPSPKEAPKAATPPTADDAGTTAETKKGG